jgi:hypothetical protein
LAGFSATPKLASKHAAGQKPQPLKSRGPKQKGDAMNASTSHSQKNHPSSLQYPHRLRRGRLAAALTTALLLAPVFAPLPAHAEIRISLPSFFTNGKTTTVELNSPQIHLRLKSTGDIAFTVAEDDIQSLSGKATLQEKRNGVLRRIVFESEPGGVVRRTYSVDGKTVPFDAEGRRWLAATLPSVIRETSINFEQRIKRIHTNGGADAVLAEIEKIETGFARGRYIEGLSKLAMLDEKQVLRLIAAIASIDSDFERRGALNAVSVRQTLSATAQISAMNVVTKMKSSFEQRSALATLTPKLAADPAVSQAWLNAAAKVDSDFELRAVIDAMAKREPLAPIYLDAMIQATLSLDSDFEHGAALNAIGRHMANATPAQVSAFMKSTQKIGSDFERKNVLTNFVNRNTLDKNGLLAVLQAIDGMGSDFEIRAVLTTVAKRMPADGELVSRYRRAARKLSDHERGQAEKALDHLDM